MMMVRRGRLAAAVAVLLLAAACAADDEASPTTGERGTQTAAPAGNNTRALDYTGATAGAADDSLEPIKVGWVNEQGGATSFPQFTEVAEITAEYVNAELGGVQGHPIEISTCFVAAPADGTTCGAQFANDPDVNVVLTGVVVTGGQQFYGVLAGRKPVFVGAAVTPADTSTEGVTSFASLGMIAKGQAVFAAEDLGAENVAVIYSDDPAGRSSFDEALSPTLEDGGVSLIGVPIPGTATGPQVQQALLAANADSADAIILSIPGQLCGPAYDGIKQYGTDAAVISNISCTESLMTEHLEQIGETGDAPDGWYFVNFGTQPQIADEQSGMATYLRVVEKYQDAPFNSAGAYYGFANLLTTVRLMNHIGADNVTAESFQQALLAFEGPAIMFGRIGCPGEPPEVGNCGKDVGVVQYEAGEWLAVRWGDDLLDTSTL